METKGIFEQKRVRVIEKEILLNGGDLDLYLDIYLTDKYGQKEHIITKKGDSILANFLRLMYLQMGRKMDSSYWGTGHYYLGQTIVGLGNISTITSAGSPNTGCFRITFNSSLLSAAPTNGKITLGGFQGISLDGRYDYNKIADNILDVLATTYADGWVTGTGGLALYFPETHLTEPSSNTFASGGIFIGTGDTAVTIDDQMLEKQIPSVSQNGGLVYNTSTVSQDTNDSTSAQITFTRTFTNSASLTVTVNEIALLMRAGSLNRTYVVMRDVLPSGVQVAEGKTLTVNYRIKTTLGTGTDPGGFLTNFMRVLYRHVAQTTRAAFDISNNSRTAGPNSPTFNVLKNGGINTEQPGESGEGYKLGIVLGRGTTAVSMGDYYLETPITHGTGTNQMLYYGGFAQDFTLGANYAQFSIVKAIENASGSAITVNEYALIGGAHANTSISSLSLQVQHMFALTRNVLTTPVTVQNGEILKVVYTLKVIE